MAEKVHTIEKVLEAKRLRVYFNNHYGGKAVQNALEFKELLGEKLPEKEQRTRDGISRALADVKAQRTLA